MNKIVCDLCGKEITSQTINENIINNKFVLPIRLFEEEIYAFQGKEFFKNTLDRGMRRTELDICPECQETFSKLFYHIIEKTNRNKEKDYKTNEFKNFVESLIKGESK